MFKPDYTELGPCDGMHKGYGTMAMGIYRGPSKGGSGGTVTSSDEGNQGSSKSDTEKGSE